MTFRAAQTALSIAASVVAVVIFGVMLLALPWFYGGVEQWVRGGVALVLAAGVAAVAVRSIVAPGRESPVATAIAILPVACLIGLAALQLAGEPVAAESDGVFMAPRSIYPADTRLALAGLIAVAAAVLVGVTVFSREPAFHGLLVLCLTAATAVAFGGIAMRLTGEDRIIRGVAAVGDPFARFVNRNNAAAFLQLGIAAGLALLRSASRPDPLERDETLLARGRGSVDRATIVMIAATFLALCLAGVAASRSRGGMLAAACTISIAVPFFRWKGLGSRLGLLAAPLVIAGTLLLWLGLSSPALERFESTSLVEVLTTGRVPHWLDASPAIAARPLFGAGLGTYGYAFQQFSSLDYQTWFEHADNQFVELFVEAGTAGALILGGVLALTAFGIYRGAGRPVERVLLAAVVVGQSVHAVFDYGVIVPATALAGAALWSAGLARLLSNPDQIPMAGQGWGARALIVGAAVLVAGGLVWSRGEHRSASAVDQYAKLARNLDRPGQIEPEKLNEAIERLTAALHRRPDDALGHVALAELLVYRYRTTATARIVQVDTTLSANDAWQLTRLSSLHRTVNTLARSGATSGIDDLRRDPMVQRSLAPARRHYLDAAEACPRLPGIWIPRACLAFLDEEDPGGTAVLETAIRLFPSNPDLLRTAGRVAWQAGDAPLAARCWQRSFYVHPDGYWDFVSALAEEAGPGEAVRLSCPDDSETILQVATNAPPDSRVDLREFVGLRLEAAAAALPEGRRKDRSLAVADRLAGRFDGAEKRIQRMIAANPGDATAHSELAKLYRDTGQMTEARDEAIVAAALDRRYEALRRQLELQNRNVPSPQDVTAGRRD
ncbi:MAG: O-antigen ligase family protein [Planctomycetaceae bacterium]